MDGGGGTAFRAEAKDGTCFDAPGGGGGGAACGIEGGGDCEVEGCLVE